MLTELFKIVLVLFGAVKVFEELKKKYYTRKLRAEIREKNRLKNIEPIAQVTSAEIREASKTQQEMFVTGLPGRKIEPINEEHGNSFKSYDSIDDGSQFVSVKQGTAVNEDGEVLPTYNGIPLYSEDPEVGFDFEEEEF